MPVGTHFTLQESSSLWGLKLESKKRSLGVNAFSPFSSESDKCCNNCLGMRHALRGALTLVHKHQCFGHAQLGASMPNAGVWAIVPKGFCLESSENVSKIGSCCPIQRNSLENHLRLSGFVLCVWMCLHLTLCNLIKLRLLHPWEEEIKKGTNEN